MKDILIRIHERKHLIQFSSRPVSVDLIPEVKTVEEIRRCVEKTRKLGGIIAYTLVEPTLRSEIVSLANEARVPTVDLIGPLLGALSKYLLAVPAHEPGLFRQADDEHWRRLDAVAFAVHHDDGLGLHELPLADLVIVGPSRTSKTPLSVYLAHTRGLKVANVPLALGIEPPRELADIKPGRLVGLTMNADLLCRVRRARLEEIGNPQITYAGLDHVQEELRFCHEIYRRPPPWRVIDVTGKSIEEISGEICAALAGA